MNQDDLEIIHVIFQRKPWETNGLTPRTSNPQIIRTVGPPVDNIRSEKKTGVAIFRVRHHIGPCRRRRLDVCSLVRSIDTASFHRVKATSNGILCFFYDY